MSSSEENRCPGCLGSGKCLKCEGSGHVVHGSVAAIPTISGEVHGKSQTRRTCSKCMGSGRCQVCKGSGVAPAS
jgi:hypothetical protein